MAISRIGFVVLYLTVVFASFIAFSSTVALGQCRGDFQGLVRQCSRFVQKTGPKSNPSSECCNVVKNVDFQCVCQHVTGEVEQIISMEKAVYVAASCGRPLVHGTKCGSYTVPMKEEIDQVII
ncbi:putative lipid-transfer protein DIR1 [Andrographis paniculata]|uniref:putative lipid-transfer protein DIR1 n=1 Tax=Andrographis paniculata TaxID=175694 RepID=UPI0021E9941D|nr:putative lipid-transfer protein DIR1 [Andrographis paniculata]